MTIVFRSILHEAIFEPLVCWQIQNVIFKFVKCFFW
ncbi:unnamed protein product [Acanthoscelides obtectus]|uniref:Uncharacterized protein n=1 Tax=Acanthoscelides obtectus TaxID=200917 RepID=A0A9P0PLD1_ACAOB|nr:unnamed protein product [Acanthoscelides obtectus]CAK1653790.1 hypothetical protein AOBTE_LOCUS18365 [Acanthoscelides obtectus]